MIRPFEKWQKISAYLFAIIIVLMFATVLVLLLGSAKIKSKCTVLKTFLSNDLSTDKLIEREDSESVKVFLR